jgi:hypothetical protein
MFIANNKLTICLLRHVSTHMSHHHALFLKLVCLQGNCAHFATQRFMKLLLLFVVSNKRIVNLLC